MEEDFLDYVKNLDSGLTTTEFAKLYGISANKFNKILADNGVQYKRKYNNKVLWILKQDFSKKGLMENSYSSYTKPNGEILIFKRQPKWTKKGLCYIYYYLKDKGVEPINLNDNKYSEIEKKIEQLSFL